MKLSNNQQAFLALVRAGLWEKDTQLSQYGNIDFNEILRLSEEQSVMGLVAAGIEHVVDVKVPQAVALQFVGHAMQLEQRNIAMNSFIADIIERMHKQGIFTLLVKGQGVAQCYERPLWRASGDIDLLLDRDNYGKAKEFLLPLVSYNKNEERYSQHLGMNIDSWYVEIHGSLRTGLSSRIDKVIDDVHRNTFEENGYRIWHNSGFNVMLPSPDNDVFFVFTHYIKHFYKEGMCLRQICDWCRLLRIFKDSIDIDLLEKRINKAELLSEWKSFSALVVEYLGLPVDEMPLYDKGKCWRNKASKLINNILKNSHTNVFRDTWSVAKVFPWKTMKYTPAIFFYLNGLKVKERLFGVDN